MINLIWQKLVKKLSNAIGKKSAEPVKLSNSKEIKKLNYSTDLNENLRNFKQIFKDCSDIKFREFEIGGENLAKAAIIYVDGLIDSRTIDDQVLKNLMININLKSAHFNIKKEVKNAVLSVTELNEEQNIEKIVDEILDGYTALFIDRADAALLIKLIGIEKRSISEPKTEVSIRGPFDHFIEDINTNISLIRRRIKSPQLKMKSMKLGNYTKTDIAISYIEGLVTEDLINEVEKRIAKIKADSILYAETIEEYLEDNRYSPFPQLDRTERPDKAVANLLEGRIVIVVDNTSEVIILPVIFAQYLQSVDDYTERPLAGSFIRGFRLVSINLALLLPSLYVAVITYHPEMLPTPLLLSIAGAREAVPFPVFVEALLMELTFEILRESGVRLPRQIGQAVSIVGALVIGQAAVQAAIVSPQMVIIVALTGIASFTIPSYSLSLAIRILRIPLIFLAGSFGLFGVLIGMLLILVHLSSLRSYGVPYMSPLAPFNLRDMKDVVVRAPWWAMVNRPRFIGFKNPQRVKTDQLDKTGKNKNKG